ncbi:IS3 family transposase [Spiroplasma endosymbiont of Polydrusus pterygomalis]|uniref:IS3 family transposase n=1 Tax=Spiroplasma endosymbiont of Polydrusus pterygomalis TaxID=3139327 RepID=UPI003CCAAC1B
MKQFGYRRITKYLKEDYGIVYNAKKVLRIMKENNIQAEYVKRMRRKILIKGIVYDEPPKNNSC